MIHAKTMVAVFEKVPLGKVMFVLAILKSFLVNIVKRKWISHAQVLGGDILYAALVSAMLSLVTILIVIEQLENATVT